MNSHRAEKYMPSELLSSISLMFCPKCGKEISDQSVQCEYCGGLVEPVVDLKNGFSHHAERVPTFQPTNPAGKPIKKKWSRPLVHVPSVTLPKTRSKNLPAAIDPRIFRIFGAVLLIAAILIALVILAPSADTNSGAAPTYGQDPTVVPISTSSGVSSTGLIAVVFTEGSADTNPTQVTVNGVVLGTITSLSPLQASLQPGLYEVTFSKSGYPDDERSVTLEEGMDTQTLEVLFSDETEPVQQEVSPEATSLETSSLTTGARDVLFSVVPDYRGYYITFDGGADARDVLSFDVIVTDENGDHLFSWAYPRVGEDLIVLRAMYGGKQGNTETVTIIGMFESRVKETLFQKIY